MSHFEPRQQSNTGDLTYMWFCIIVVPQVSLVKGRSSSGGEYVPVVKGLWKDTTKISRTKNMQGNVHQIIVKLDLMCMRMYLEHG